MRVLLETERLLLRRFAEADVDRLLALHNDPAEVMRFINGGKPTSREEVEREYRERFAGDGFWAAVEKATGEFVGWFALHPAEGGGPEGYEPAWGKVKIFVARTAYGVTSSLSPILDSARSICTT